MARKKSAEELAIEAELAAARTAAQTGDEAGGKPAHVDDVLPEVPDDGRAAGSRADRAVDSAAQVAGSAGLHAARVGRKAKGLVRAASGKKPSWLSRRLATRAGKVQVVCAVLAVALLVFVIVRIVDYYSWDSWDGTSDVSWYNPELSADEQPSSYTLATAEQLAGLSKLVNYGCDNDHDPVSFEGVQFTLAHNLDMGDQPFTPIGVEEEASATYEFAGSFDGAGHVIAGLDIDEEEHDEAGLFACTDGGVIENLTVEGKVMGRKRVGGIVGEAKSTTLRNCTNRCNVTSTLAGTTTAPVEVEVGGVAGICLCIAQDAPSVTCENLVNEGDVSAVETSVGGVIGEVANSTYSDERGTHDRVFVLKDCKNTGKVTNYAQSESREDGCGGIVGEVNSLGVSSMENCVNEGEVSCSSVMSVGGIVGSWMAVSDENRDSSIAACSNSGAVSSNSPEECAHVGGIVGYLDDEATRIEGCSNTGELRASSGNTDDIVGYGYGEVWDAWDEAQPKLWA